MDEFHFGMANLKNELKIFFLSFLWKTNGDEKES